MTRLLSIHHRFFSEDCNFFLKSKTAPTFSRVEFPINRGISSSAAICVSLLKTINNYYKLKIKNREIALLAQKVEKEYVGVTGGIMDQMVSSIGFLNKAFFLNCTNLKYEIIDIPKDYLFCLEFFQMCRLFEYYNQLFQSVAVNF